MKLQTSFEEILLLLRRRDASVLAILLKQYSNRLVSYAQRRWQFTLDEISELLYQTFDVLLRRADQLTFEAQAPFDAFIFGVFINKLREAHRKRSYEAQRFIPVDTLERIDNSSTGEDANDDELEPFDNWYNITDDTLEQERIEQLAKALATLSAEDRELLLLWAQGYSYPAIGELLNINPQHLKVRCYRAKQRVIKWFAEHINTTIP